MTWTRPTPAARTEALRRGHGSRTQARLGWALAGWACLLLGACQGSGLTVALPLECPEDPLLSLEVPPPSPSMVDTEVYPDATLPGVTGLVLDPRPLGRGEHGVQRWWRDPEACGVAGGAYTWGPPAPALPSDDPAPPAQTTPEDGWSRVRALVVTGPDPGADEDARRWVRTFERLGAIGFHVPSPGRATLEATIDALCEEVAPVETTILVTTGRASRTAAGDAFLSATGDAISWARLGERYLERCQAAGLRIWVVDAAFAPRLDDLAFASAAPTLMWAASSPERPDAPRIAPRRGGLLSLALTERVDAESGSACLSTQVARAADLWSAFGDQAAVVARMRADRWERYGAQTVAAAVEGSTGSPDPLLSARVVAEVTGDLPLQPLTQRGGAPPQSGCVSDEDCEEIDAVCSPGACRRFLCNDAGLCRAGPDLGAECDDGSSCTVEDRCDELGLCRGRLVECDDGNACTIDTCLFDAGCVASPIGAGEPCDDGKLCTLGDRCDASGTCVGDLVSCDDGIYCTTDLCDQSVGCVHGATIGACDDGDLCTHQDFCVDAVCRGAPLPCEDGEACTSTACDPATGCLFAPVPDGLGCDDGDGCTGDDRCAGGTCVGTSTICDDDLECTLDLCEDGTCVHLPAPGLCAYGDGCVEVGETLPDAPCLECVATGVLAPAPGSEGAPCADDGVSCTTDVCREGVCSHEDLDGWCHDEVGTCVPVGGFIHPCLQCVATGTGATAPAGTACDDNDACTAGDTCSAQAICSGAKLTCCSSDPVSACGDLIEGNTATDPQAASNVDDWACLTSLSFLSAERSHAFEAPCDGIVTFQFVGVPGLLLFVTPGEVGLPDSAESACAEATCDGYTAGPANRLMSAGQWFQVTVDGNSGAHGAYTIEIECACNEEPQP